MSFYLIAVGSGEAGDQAKQLADRLADAFSVDLAPHLDSLSSTGVCVLQAESIEELKTKTNQIETTGARWRILDAVGATVEEQGAAAPAPPVPVAAPGVPAQPQASAKATLMFGTGTTLSGGLDDLDEDSLVMLDGSDGDDEPEPSTMTGVEHLLNKPEQSPLSLRDPLDSGLDFSSSSEQAVAEEPPAPAAATAAPAPAAPTPIAPALEPFPDELAEPESADQVVATPPAAADADATEAGETEAGEGEPNEDDFFPAELPVRKPVSPSAAIDSISGPLPGLGNDPLAALASQAAGKADSTADGEPTSGADALPPPKDPLAALSSNTSRIVPLGGEPSVSKPIPAAGNAPSGQTLKDIGPPSGLKSMPTDTSPNSVASELPAPQPGRSEPLRPIGSQPSNLQGLMARRQTIAHRKTAKNLQHPGLLFGGRLHEFPKLRVLVGFILAVSLGSIFPICYAKSVRQDRLQPLLVELSTVKAHGHLMTQLPTYRPAQEVEDRIDKIRFQNQFFTLICWMGLGGMFAFVWFKYT